MNIWKQLKHFKRSENWGSPELMSHDLLLELDAWRKYINTEVIISCGVQGMHADNSWHYKGLAVDLIVPGMNAFDAFISALRFDFSGIGLYNDWQYQGSRTGGLHLDVRPIMPADPRALWFGTRSDLDERVYKEINHETIGGLLAAQ